MKNEPVSIRTLIMPLNKPRYRNTLRHDSKAVRMVGDVAASGTLSPDLLRSNEELAIFGPLLSTSAKPSFESTSPQIVNALLTKKRNRPGVALSLKT
jgi:hypothetical protein